MPKPSDIIREVAAAFGRDFREHPKIWSAAGAGLLFHSIAFSEMWRGRRAHNAATEVARVLEAEQAVADLQLPELDNDEFEWELELLEDEQSEGLDHDS